jgi:hypothetical protein
VVAISNSRLSDKDKNNQLANYLYEAMQKAAVKSKIDSIGMARLPINEVMENIRNSETYLDGIAAAGPLISTIVSALQTRLDEIQADVPVIIAGFDREIEKDFSVIRDNFLELKGLQGHAMKALTHIYKAKIGSAASIDTLLRMDASLKAFIPSATNASYQQIQAAEEHLIRRLNMIDSVIRQLDDDVADYRAKQNELEEWRVQVDEKIRIARNAITVWAQSHRNLGNGIPVPPMIDVAGFATGLIGGAAQKVVP